MEVAGTVGSKPIPPEKTNEHYGSGGCGKSTYKDQQSTQVLALFLQKAMVDLFSFGFAVDGLRETETVELGGGE